MLKGYTGRMGISFFIPSTRKNQDCADNLMFWNFYNLLKVVGFFEASVFASPRE